jgi:hypothetical protein
MLEVFQRFLTLTSYKFKSDSLSLYLSLFIETSLTVKRFIDTMPLMIIKDDIIRLIFLNKIEMC